VLEPHLTVECPVRARQKAAKGDAVVCLSERRVVNAASMDFATLSASSALAMDPNHDNAIGKERPMLRLS